MRSIYRTFEDSNSRSIPNCKIEAGNGIKADGAFENDESLWVQLNEISLLVVKYVNGRWEGYGEYLWRGAVAVKPDVAYDIVTNAPTFPEGTYGLMNFAFKTAPRTSGLFYQNGSFDLRFTR